MTRHSTNAGIFLRDSVGVGIVEKVIKHVSFESLAETVSSRKPFGLEGNFIKTTKFHPSPIGLTDPVKCFD